MNLPFEAIKQFQEIYQRKFGVVLSEAEAKLKADKFLNLMLVITSKNGTKKDQA